MILEPLPPRILAVRRIPSADPALLAAYGDITYLVIFVTLMIFLAIRPQGLMGKPWG